MKTYLITALAGLMLVSCGAPPVVKPHPRPNPNASVLPPLPPKSVHYQLTAGLVRTNNYKINLKWFPSPTVSVVGYQIWLGTISGQPTNVTTVGNVTNIVIGGLRVATYYVVVTATDASGAMSTPTLELKVLAPSVVYTPTNLVVACNLTNTPFKLYSATNLLVPMRQWSWVMATNSFFLPWSKIPPYQFFYGLDLNTNRVPLAIWTTGILTTNYSN